MSGHRTTDFIAMAGAAAGCSLWLAPAAFAGTGSALDGQYMVTFSANQKTGTSAAARHARSRPVGQILVHLELLDRRLRRQGQRRAASTSLYASSRVPTPGTGRSG